VAKDLVKDIEDEDGFININLEIEQGSEFLEGTIVVDVIIGTKGERTRL
jgi:hypothetical protein